MPELHIIRTRSHMMPGFPTVWQWVISLRGCVCSVSSVRCNTILAAELVTADVAAVTRAHLLSWRGYQPLNHQQLLTARQHGYNSLRVSILITITLATAIAAAAAAAAADRLYNSYSRLACTHCSHAHRDDDNGDTDAHWRTAYVILLCRR